MEYTVPGLNHISQASVRSATSSKPKMLVVDDESNNLDMLYRMFRREFQVLRAESGAAALEILKTEGEVAVIISDQRMPGMKGTEFLSRTVPDFPDTLRIILTGFTDIEDLVEAINTGQVYKYMTKPWDPQDLTAVAQAAVTSYAELKQRTDEIRRSQAQKALLTQLAQLTQSTSDLESSLQAIVESFVAIFDADHGVLRLSEDDQIKVISEDGATPDWLEQDPLVQAAITSQQMQGCCDVTLETDLANLPQYESIKAHMVVPVVVQSSQVAMLSLQWESPYQLSEDDLLLLHLTAQQMGWALVSSWPMKCTCVTA